MKNTDLVLHQCQKCNQWAHFTGSCRHQCQENRPSESAESEQLAATPFFSSPELVEISDRKVDRIISEIVTGIRKLDPLIQQRVFNGVAQQFQAWLPVKKAPVSVGASVQIQSSISLRKYESLGILLRPFVDLPSPWQIRTFKNRISSPHLDTICELDVAWMPLPDSLLLLQQRIASCAEINAIKIGGDSAQYPQDIGEGPEVTVICANSLQEPHFANSSSFSVVNCLFYGPHQNSILKELPIFKNRDDWVPRVWIHGDLAFLQDFLGQQKGHANSWCPWTICTATDYLDLEKEYPTRTEFPNSVIPIHSVLHQIAPPILHLYLALGGALIKFVKEKCGKKTTFYDLVKPYRYRGKYWTKRSLDSLFREEKEELSQLLPRDDRVPFTLLCGKLLGIYQQLAQTKIPLDPEEFEIEAKSFVSDYLTLCPRNRPFYLHVLGIVFPRFIRANPGLIIGSLTEQPLENLHQFLKKTYKNRFRGLSPGKKLESMLRESNSRLYGSLELEEEAKFRKLPNTFGQ